MVIFTFMAWRDWIFRFANPCLIFNIDKQFLWLGNNRKDVKTENYIWKFYNLCMSKNNFYISREMLFIDISDQPFIQLINSCFNNVIVIILAIMYLCENGREEQLIRLIKMFFLFTPHSLSILQLSEKHFTTFVHCLTTIQSISNIPSLFYNICIQYPQFVVIIIWSQSFHIISFYHITSISFT